jgi:hypothetical protein
MGPVATSIFPFLLGGSGLGKVRRNVAPDVGAGLIGAFLLVLSSSFAATMDVHPSIGRDIANSVVASKRLSNYIW